jgi:hypothetical protein
MNLVSSLEEGGLVSPHEIGSVRLFSDSTYSRNGAMKADERVMKVCY